MITRKIFRNLLEQSEDRRISLLVGARQVGKTTLLKALFDELSKKYKCLFLDLDILSNYEKISSFESLVNLITVNGYEKSQKNVFYLLMDEFQRFPSVARIMKNVHDNLPNVKIYASGSSSMAVKDQIQESLAGRKLVNEIFPLDFEEFLIFRGEGELAAHLGNIKKLRGGHLAETLSDFKRLLKEFMIFGGYPEVALHNSKEKKIEVLSSIFDLYVKKDLVEYLNIEKILHVKRLIEFIAVNNAQKTKYEEIGKVATLNFVDVKRYLDILEETYLIEIIRPFFKNKNKELVKIPKIYFIDNGVRNFFINNFNELSLRDDAGFLFEGFVLSELVKSGITNIKFWQDKNLVEVDFIMEKNGKIVPAEVKFKEDLKSADFSGLRTFMDSYKQVKEAFLVNLDMQKAEKGILLILPYRIGEEIGSIW